MLNTILKAPGPPDRLNKLKNWFFKKSQNFQKFAKNIKISLFGWYKAINKYRKTAKWGAPFGGFKLIFDCFVRFLDCFGPFLIVFSDFLKFLIKLVLRLFYCNLGPGLLVVQAGLGPRAQKRPNIDLWNFHFFTKNLQKIKMRFL